MPTKNDYKGMAISPSGSEQKNREVLLELFLNSPIPDDLKMYNLGLFIKRQDLTRILFFHELYKKVIPIHGVVAEFGVRLGQTLALFESFHGIYEPYNNGRKILGFDTFAGLASIVKQDGNSVDVRAGNLSVPKDYQSYLEKILSCHEKESPVSHIKKFQIIKGDACKTVPNYLKEYPETIFALVFFDFDIYKPTKDCLEAIKPHLTKGSIVAFDQLNAHNFPGETVALKDAFGLQNVRIQRIPFLSSEQSFFIVE
jgi:hypothetical protein